MIFGLFRKTQDINLIPEEEQKIRVDRIRFITLLILSFVIFGELLLYFFVFTITAREGSTKTDLEKQISQKTEEWQKLTTVATQAKIIKTKLGRYQTFNNQHPSTPSLVGKIQKVLPSGVVLTRISVTNVKEASIQAKASDPGVVYQFFNILQERKEDFESVELEGVDKQATEGYSFIMSLKIK